MGGSHKDPEPSQGEMGCHCRHDVSCLACLRDEGESRRFSQGNRKPEPRAGRDLSKVTQEVGNRSRKRPVLAAAAAHGSPCRRHPDPLKHQMPQPSVQHSSRSEELQASPQTLKKSFMKKWREQLCDYSLNFALIQHCSPLRHD